MQDNLQDIPSSLLSQSETFNIIPSGKKKVVIMCVRKNELSLTVTSYSVLRMNFTQEEI